MKITRIEIVPIKPNQGLIGFANIILENQLFIGSIGIHPKLHGDGFRLTTQTERSAIQCHDFSPGSIRFKPSN